jgi:hypothetical protein
MELSDLNKVKELSDLNKVKYSDDLAVARSSATLSFTDLLSALMLSIVVLMTVVYVRLGVTETMLFFERDTSKTGIMIISAALAAAAFYFAYRSAQRTAQRAVIRAQTHLLLDRLDDLEKQLTQKRPEG